MLTRLTSILELTTRRHTGSVLAIFAVAALVAGFFALQVRISPALDHLLLKDDPERARSHEIKQEFSNDEILVLAVDLGRPFDATDLRELDRLAERIAGIDGVEEVLALSTIEDVRGSDDGLDASALVDFDTLDERLDEIRMRVGDHPLYRQNLVSEDTSVLGLLVLLEVRNAQHDLNTEVTGQIMKLVSTDAAGHARGASGYSSSDGLGHSIWVSGYPAAEYESMRLVFRDLSVLTGPALLVVASLMYLAMRRTAAVALLVVLVAWVEIIALAWLGATGTPITLVSSIVPASLLAISSTYAIYFVGLLQRAAGDEDPATSVVRTITRPAIISALSSITGFLSLRLIPVDVIGQLGTGLAIGTCASALGTLVLLPAVAHRMALRIAQPRHTWLVRLSTLGVRFAQRPRLVLLCAAATSTVAVAGLTQLQIDSDPLNYWRSDSYHRQSDKFIVDRLSGTLPINVVVTSDVPGGVLEPSVLEFANELTHELERSPIVDRTISFLDYLQLMDEALTPELSGRRVLPSREHAAQYLLLYEAGGDPNDYRHYINYDRSALNVVARVRSRSSSEVLALRSRILAFADAAAPGVRVEVLGSWFQFSKAMDAITGGMVSGLVVALGLIAVVMTVSLRSLRFGLVATIVNGLPIVFCLGALGWAGIPLSFGTSIVGCVALGLAVDDTAHVLGHLSSSRPLVRTYEDVGPALILTTLSLGAGFAAVGLSEFVPISLFGLGTTLTLLVALLADLFLLPSILVVFGLAYVEPQIRRRPAPVGNGYTFEPLAAAYDNSH